MNLPYYAYLGSQIIRFANGDDRPIDPASGVPLDDWQPSGTPQGPQEGTGEGRRGWAGMQGMGFNSWNRQPQLAQPATESVPLNPGGSLVSGFDMNWLANRLSAATAEGQHLFPRGSQPNTGGGGGSKKKKSPKDEEEGPEGGFGEPYQYRTKWTLGNPATAARDYNYSGAMSQAAGRLY